MEFHYSVAPETLRLRLQAQAPDSVVQFRQGLYGEYETDGSFRIYYVDPGIQGIRGFHSKQRCWFRGVVHPSENGSKITGTFNRRKTNVWLWVVVLAILIAVCVNILREGGSWVDVLMPAIFGLAFFGFYALLEHALDEDPLAEQKILALLNTLDYPGDGI